MQRCVKRELLPRNFINNFEPYHSLYINGDYFALQEDVNTFLNETVKSYQCDIENPKYIVIVEREDTICEWKEKILSRIKDISILTISNNDTITNEIPFDIMVLSLECYHYNFYNGLNELPVKGILCYIESPDAFSTLISLVQYTTINMTHVPFFSIFYLSKATTSTLISFSKVLYDSEDTIIGYLPMMGRANIFNRNIKLLPTELPAYVGYARRLNWKVKTDSVGVNFETIMNDIKNYVSGTLCLAMSKQSKRVMTFIPISNRHFHSEDEYTFDTIENINDISTYPFLSDYDEKIEAMLRIVKHYSNAPFYYMVLYSATGDSDEINFQTKIFEDSLRKELHKEIQNENYSVININTVSNVAEIINSVKAKEIQIKIIFYNILILNENYLSLLLSTNLCECYQLFYYNSIEHDFLYAYYTSWYKTIRITQQQIDSMNKRRMLRCKNYQKIIKDINFYEEKNSDGILIYDRNMFFYTKNGNFLFERNQIEIPTENFVQFTNENLPQFPSEHLEITSGINRITCRSLRIARADDLKSYLQQLSRSAKQNGEKINELHSFLENNGCGAELRRYILDVIMKRGVNFECFHDQMKNFTLRISEVFDFQFDSNIIGFYFEYFLLNLDSSAPNSLVDSFLYFDITRNAIKHKLLLINFVLNVSGHDRRFLRTKVNVLLKSHKETIYKMLPRMSRENAKELELIGEGMLILFEESYVDGFYDYERYIRKESFVERIVSTIRIKRSDFYTTLFGREIPIEELCDVMVQLFNFVCGEILL